jgi:hypothetical protein
MTTPAGEGVPPGPDSNFFPFLTRPGGNAGLENFELVMSTDSVVVRFPEISLGDPVISCVLAGGGFDGSGSIISWERLLRRSSRFETTPTPPNKTHLPPQRLWGSV